jgi:hypothetical protein
VRFFDTEIWAPDWNQVDKTGITPDIFIRLYNEPDSHIAREGLVVAIKKSVGEKNSEAIESVIADISRRMPNASVARITRSWWRGSGFSNQIQDMNNYELEAIVRGHTKPTLAGRVRSWFAR